MLMLFTFISTSTSTQGGTLGTAFPQNMSVSGKGSRQGIELRQI